jgi:aminotransferase in exopolysaccharide biosynthesis
MTASFTGASHAVAVVNGTAALHIALKLVGVEPGDEVVTQSLTFVATCNAIAYCGAEPSFVDVEEGTMGMSPESLESFFAEHTIQKEGKRVDRHTNRPISAVVPMHTFGHPCRIEDIARICEEYGVPLVEDSAESLGSYYKGRHTGTFGKVGVFSYNGNKTITTGGGGMLVTHDEEIARRAKHLTTTAKLPHAWEYVHDEIGFNYRLPNINAALGCAQMERLEEILRDKRAVAERYREFFAQMDGVHFIDEPEGAKSNFWLNALLFDNPEHKELFLEETNPAGVMTRPIWRPMHELPMYDAAFRTPLPVAEYLAERIVNIPSGARI